MSLKGKGTTAPLVKAASTAPFVFFDNVPAYGVAGGIVEVELTSRVVVPIGDGQVATDMICTGHLRCSAPAAVALIASLTKAVEMLKAPAAPQRSDN